MHVDNNFCMVVYFIVRHLASINYVVLYLRPTTDYDFQIVPQNNTCFAYSTIVTNFSLYIHTIQILHIRLATSPML
jgi:hypothetical protein